MQDHSPKLPCDFLCFCCKRPSWIMLDITFWVVSSAPFGIFKKYWSPIILCEGCNSSNCGSAAFSQIGETGGRKLTVLCQKTEPVETSCKQVNCKWRDKWAWHPVIQRKKTQTPSHGVHFKGVGRLFEISCQVYLFQQNGKLHAAFPFFFFFLSMGWNALELLQVALNIKFSLPFILFNKK